MDTHSDTITSPGRIKNKKNEKWQEGRGQFAAINAVLRPRINTDIGNAIQTVFDTFESRHIQTFRSTESSFIRVNVTASLKKIINVFR